MIHKNQFLHTNHLKSGT